MIGKWNLVSVIQIDRTGLSCLGRRKKEEGWLVRAAKISTEISTAATLGTSDPLNNFPSSAKS